MNTRQSFSRHYNGDRNGYRNNRPNITRQQQNFHPSLFIKKAEIVENTEFVPKNRFSDFALHPLLKQNVLLRGYKTPTPIQDGAIPHILNGRDVVGLANTGTGKTAAFLLPLIHKVLLDRNEKVLIIAPTRELAIQIEEEFILFAKNTNIVSVLCIGGLNIERQTARLRRNHNFLIATPGRLLDLEHRGDVQLHKYTSIVLDEVDRMLDMGFVRDVKYIISKLPQKKHSLFFSATLPDAVKGIMQSFLHNPVSVSIKSPHKTSGNVEQDVVRLEGRQKIEVLHDLLIKNGFTKVLVFGRTKHGMNKLAKELHERGFTVAAIHGNKSQNQRQLALQRFKSDAVQILLATDIASRGLDIDDITHVINYDLPDSYEDYIHRIGRTGRAEKKGYALTLME